MSQTTPDSLFSPEGTVLTDPAEVERALARMWKLAGEKAAGETTTKTASRVSVANLVVVAPAAQWDQLLELMAEFSPIYPTRSIVLLITEEASEPREITVSVSALCHVPQADAPQVCCEQIVLRAGPRHVETLDRTLLPLLESDVSVMCWWRYAPDAWPTLSTAIKRMARRFIIDHPSGFRGLESTECCAVRALGWYRTADLRELLAQMFDGSAPEVLESIEEVEIHTGSGAERRDDAFWLIAFLAGQLGWTPAGVETITDGADAERHFAATYLFRLGQHTIRVHFVMSPETDCRLRRIRIVSGPSTFTLESHPARESELRMVICSRGICQAPRSVQAPPIRPSQALADAMVGRQVDAAFERAAPIAAWLVKPQSE
ncbi:MAG TPA: glucose-6-phosphate dehydrogenase assembly protein OpcA [Phycisphaerae bacterium]|jgi:glucose-6-phosphate dehydrogenase assembly protein OpcA|nr:hypothetical protein [Phycisphaerae bacterium]HOB74724.1 glucose-6-phosphate dehydrogenase assembly protein OpcA [Phycisphaerae bacterium]HOJ55272.1 glucose-6-phosphate dehydrogenase assembly protein OpcA [Phycisphaerae bacterium]HOL27901.1 glucose-6-phosphate dehydrogenase assembly protein OpcA [Phycisphaerae bacterium]HPP22350.1 glucose-6-phosphate dehydrogenase assembly protein OpcA [Phycisphaerae bacterium]